MILLKYWLLVEWENDPVYLISSTPLLGQRLQDSLGTVRPIS